MKLKTILIFLLLLPLSAFSQQQEEEDDGEQVYEETYKHKIDSIKKFLEADLDDSLLKKYYGEIAYFSQIPDTIIKYGNLSLPLCNKTDYFLLGQNNYHISQAYRMIGDNETAHTFSQKALTCYKKINYLIGIAECSQLLSYIFDDLNNLDSAVYYMTNVLETGNRLKDTAMISECYQDFGRLYGQRELYQESEMYLRKALVLDSLSHDRFRYAIDLFYIVQLIDSQDSNSVEAYFLARNYMTKVIAVLDTTTSYQKYLAYGTCVSVYNQLAKMTNENKYADSSFYYYKKAEPFFKTSGGLSNYRLFKMNYVDYLLYYKKYDAAIKVMQELEDTFNEDEETSQHADFYKIYKDIYLALGDYKNAYFYVEKMHEYERATYNDSSLSVLSEVKARQISMLEKLEREKTEEIHNADKRRLRTLIIALLVGLGLVFRIFWIKNKANKDLSEKKQEVENINQKLLSSINYAERIQRAAISKIEDVKALFPDSFVFYRPRDIVSGDFYRSGKCGKYSVMITADCTGHGIPGAFLSMLGLSALKEFMVTEYDAENPGTVLDRIRDFIKSTLISDQKNKTVDDGMDMTICCFDFEKMEMRYAIAEQIAVIIRKGEPIKLKGNSMPVGYYHWEKDHFQTQIVKIEKGDMIYTFSDGIPDQLGSNKQRKFLLKNLVRLLTSFAEKPVEEQCQILEEKITDWRGNTPQVDDMTLIGIRV